jgi:hypothetical protein
MRQKILPRVQDVVRVQRALDGAHHVDRAVAGLGAQEVHLVQAHAVFAGAGAAELQRARHQVWLSASEMRCSSGLAGSIR